MEFENRVNAFARKNHISDGQCNCVCSRFAELPLDHLRFECTRRIVRSETIDFVGRSLGVICVANCQSKFIARSINGDHVKSGVAIHIDVSVV